MRKMEITEFDSGCYHIKTTDFQNTDSVEYTWDQTTQKFYGEYQMATVDKRQFQRDTFMFKDYPTIGDATNFIWRREREMCEAHWNALVASNRPQERVRDVITV